MKLKLIIWNVEHGNAITLISPTKKYFLFDLGANTNGFSPINHICKYKKSQRNIDGLIITHPHKDHIDDILNFTKLGLHEEIHQFVRPMNIGKEYFNDYFKQNLNSIKVNDKKKFQDYLLMHEKYPNTYITKNSPFHPNNNGGIKFNFFKPNKSSLSNINNHSIVTIISYLDKKILIPGDNETQSWKELLKNSKFRKAIEDVDIFIASHHGRLNGYYADLFSYFSPKLIIVSDGPGTKTSAVKRYFKHVHEPFNVHFKKQDKIKQRKCLTTRKDKAIILSFDSSEIISVKTTT